jgi:hypothetical protein
MSAKAVQRHVWDFAGLESFSVVVHVQFACLVGGSLVAAVKVCQNFAVGVVEKSLRCEQSDVAPSSPGLASTGSQVSSPSMVRQDEQVGSALGDAIRRDDAICDDALFAELRITNAHGMPKRRTAMPLVVWYDTNPGW